MDSITLALRNELIAMEERLRDIADMKLPYDEGVNWAARTNERIKIARLAVQSAWIGLEVTYNIPEVSRPVREVQ